MWVLLCLFSGIGMFGCICWIFWTAGWRQGHQDAWDEITAEFQRYD